MTPLDQLRLRLPAHDFDRLMQAAKPVAESARDAMLKDIAAELGQHEVVGPGLLHRIIRKCSGAMMSLTNAVLRHKNGKTRDGCEGVGHGGQERLCSELHGRAAAMTGVLR